MEISRHVRNNLKGGVASSDASRDPVLEGCCSNHQVCQPLGHETLHAGCRLSTILAGEVSVADFCDACLVKQNDSAIRFKSARQVAKSVKRRSLKSTQVPFQYWNRR